jgi:hypothetical protein
MEDIGHPPDDFGAAFEASFAHFQIRVEEACATRTEWPWRIAAAIRAGFEFAVDDPRSASLLTREALAAGPDGIARHQRLLTYIAEGFAEGRDGGPEGKGLPELTERAVAWSMVMLVAERLEHNRLPELPAIVPQAVEFALTPYVGAAEAKRIAASG